MGNTLLGVNAQSGVPVGTPEELLARAFMADLGVTINPQALRIFIRWRWERVQALAHKIHDEE